MICGFFQSSPVWSQIFPGFDSKTGECKLLNIKGFHGFPGFPGFIPTPRALGDVSARNSHGGKGDLWRI